MPAEFIRALEVAESVSESNHRVELTFGEHEITVSAESACGRSSAPVKALVLNAPKQPFYYNSRKLLEICAWRRRRSRWNLTNSAFSWSVRLHPVCAVSHEGACSGG